MYKNSLDECRQSGVSVVCYRFCCRSTVIRFEAKIDVKQYNTIHLTDDNLNLPAEVAIQGHKVVETVFTDNFVMIHRLLDFRWKRPISDEPGTNAT